MALSGAGDRCGIENARRVQEQERILPQSPCSLPHIDPRHPTLKGLMKSGPAG